MRGRFSFFAVSLLVCVLLCGILLSSGCAWIGSALNMAGGTLTTPEASGGSPSYTGGAAEEPAVSQPPAENPVFALISAFVNDFEAAALGMRDAASDKGADTVACCMKLWDCEAKLALVNATVGMLTAEGQGWSGSFLDVYAGSGSMSSRGVFEYLLEDGRSIAGRAGGDELYAVIGYDVEAPEDEPLASETPTDAPSETPHGEEQVELAPEPSSEPTQEPTAEPTAKPTAEPTPYVSDADAITLTLRRTESGWLFTLVTGGTEYVTEINEGGIVLLAAASNGASQGLQSAFTLRYKSGEIECLPAA